MMIIIIIIIIMRIIIIIIKIMITIYDNKKNLQLDCVKEINKYSHTHTHMYT